MPRIVLDPTLWRTVRAAAALEGVSPGRWLENLARRELASSLPSAPEESNGREPDAEEDSLDGPED